jgi:hypothetical protein
METPFEYTTFMRGVQRPYARKCPAIDAIPPYQYGGMTYVATICCADVVPGRHYCERHKYYVKMPRAQARDRCAMW